jgi:hypothetical protein
MSVPQHHVEVGVTKQLTNCIEIDARLNESAREVVA